MYLSLDLDVLYVSTNKIETYVSCIFFSASFYISVGG